jgi:hypothetical protein
MWNMIVSYELKRKWKEVFIALSEVFAQTFAWRDCGANELQSG